MAEPTPDNSENQHPVTPPQPAEEPPARWNSSDGQESAGLETENPPPLGSAPEHEQPLAPEAEQLSGPEAFARFLAFLAPDADEASRRYIRLQKKLIGFFNLKGVTDPARAADETIDRATRKIIAGTPVPDLDKYCLGIARHVCQEELRLTQRDIKAYRKFIADLDDGSAAQVHRIYRYLRPCYEELDDKDRELLAAYCAILHGRARAEHRQQLAERMQTTVLALRMRVTRLRRNLTDCVKKRAQED